MMHSIKLKLTDKPCIADWLNLLAKFKVASLTQLQSVSPISNLDICHYENTRVLVRLDIPTISGGMKTILGLGRKGAEIIAAESGREVSSIPYFTPTRFKRSMFTIEHELGITQLGLCLDALSSKAKLIHWETSPQRIGTSVRVMTKKGLASIPLVADAFFGVGVNKQSHWFLLELDRGTIDLKRMRRKFAGYREWWQAQGPKQRFGIKNMRVIYLVPNQKRLKALMKLWREVTEHGGKGFIWFALHDVADTTKPEKILGSHFNRVDSVTSQPLFNQITFDIKKKRPGS